MNKQTAKLALQVIAFLLLVAVLAVLSGCGGGDPEEDQRTTMPVDCKVKPEACK